MDGIQELALMQKVLCTILFNHNSCFISETDIIVRWHLLNNTLRIPVNWQISSDRKWEFFKLLAEITGSPGTPKVDIEFSGRIGEKMEVYIERGPENINIQKLELIVNNQVVGQSTQVPAEFTVDELGKNIMSDNHWIKARLTYEIEGREVVVESPYYNNPWWPYGGPSQD